MTLAIISLLVCWDLNMAIAIEHSGVKPISNWVTYCTCRCVLCANRSTVGYVCINVGLHLLVMVSVVHAVVNMVVCSEEITGIW